MRRNSKINEEILLEEFRNKKDKDTFLNKVYLYEDKEPDTAYIDTVTWDIYINKKFVQKLMKKGLDQRTVYSGILNHEIGHHKYFPYSLDVNLMEIDFAMKEEIPPQVMGLFDDFIDNTHLIVYEKEKDIAEIYKKIDDGIMHILNLYYTKLCQWLNSKSSFTTTVEEELPREVNELLKIEIDLENPYKNIKRLKEFHEIIKEYPLQEKSFEDLIREITKKYGIDNVKEKVHELEESEKISPNTARKINEELDKKIKEAHGKPKQNTKNFQPPSSTTMYYKHLEKAREYHIKIKREDPTLRIIPEHIDKIPLSEMNPTYIDPYTSFLSGRMNLCKWNKTSDDVKKDLVLIIDSSGSMVNPELTLSTAVISAMTIAMHYIENGKVAVANFSDETRITEFTNDEDTVYHAIYEYQGGSTYLDTKKVEEILDESQNKDVVMITDEQISNYKETINLFGSKTRETYIISINKYSKSGIEEDRNIKKIYVNNPDEIADIVIGEQNKL